MTVGLSGCKSDKDTVMFKVNGDKATKADLMMHNFFMKYQQYYDDISDGTVTLSSIYQLTDAQLATQISEGDHGDYLKYLSANSLMSSIMMRQMAKKEGIKIEKEDKDSIASAKTSFIKTVGFSAAYNTFLKKIGSNDKAYDRYMIDITYSNKLYELYSDGGKYALTEQEIADGKKSFAEEYITVRHILFNTINMTTGADLSEEEAAAAKTKAGEVLALLRAGGDFTELMKQYSAESAPSAFTFTKDQMVDEFEEAAFALTVGEISDVVKTKYGYHIIIRDATDYSGDTWTKYYSSLIQNIQRRLTQNEGH